MQIITATQCSLESLSPSEVVIACQAGQHLNKQTYANVVQCLEFCCMHNYSKYLINEVHTYTEVLGHVNTQTLAFTARLIMYVYELLV